MARWRNRIGVAWFNLPWVRERWARRYRPPTLEATPWTPLPAPLAQCRLALITTGGVHLRGDPPFDMSDPEGDASFRPIPHAAAPPAPPRPRRAALREGWIGSATPCAYSLMGHILGRRLAELREKTAPELARRLLA